MTQAPIDVTQIYNSLRNSEQDMKKVFYLWHFDKFNTVMLENWINRLNDEFGWNIDLSTSTRDGRTRLSQLKRSLTSVLNQHRVYEILEAFGVAIPDSVPFELIDNIIDCINQLNDEQQRQQQHREQQRQHVTKRQQRQQQQREQRIQREQQQQLEAKQRVKDIEVCYNLDNRIDQNAVFVTDDFNQFNVDNLVQWINRLNNEFGWKINLHTGWTDRIASVRLGRLKQSLTTALNQHRVYEILREYGIQTEPLQSNLIDDIVTYYNRFLHANERFKQLHPHTQREYETDIKRKYLTQWIELQQRQQQNRQYNKRYG